jgi:hypothetical protein
MASFGSLWHSRQDALEFGDGSLAFSTAGAGAPTACAIHAAHNSSPPQDRLIMRIRYDPGGGSRPDTMREKGIWRHHSARREKRHRIG